VTFYLMDVVGLMVFANGTDGATWAFGISPRRSGSSHYAAYDLTDLAVLRHWSWTAAAVDMAWGSVVTGVAAALGLIIFDFILPRT
jgi:uncharacterized membrane protein